MIQSPDENKANDLLKAAGKLRFQALALILFILSPLGAFFAWQYGMLILIALFLILIGIAFVLTMISG